MKTEKGSIFIKYGLSLWYLAFCLLLCLSVTDGIKAKPEYQNKNQSSTIKEARQNPDSKPTKILS